MFLSATGISSYGSPSPHRRARLGFDPLYIDNEGKLVCFVPREDAEKVLSVMKKTLYGEGAVIIGEAAAEPKGRVLLKTAIGSMRVVDMLAGEMLPRIC